ncbi:hypothetical protein FRX31_009917 [Thalictrum thalictroides]|uniref:F-box protein n=1 Tax=Thalictrum thalictroides TaxID=46969 RepID=A0A7J6WUD0_THATH|nr:hypothetical protein FRX31_009917 [Thalictrum thalictroides]
MELSLGDMVLAFDVGKEQCGVIELRVPWDLKGGYPDKYCYPLIGHSKGSFHYICLQVLGDCLQVWVLDRGLKWTIKHLKSLEVIEKENPCFPFHQATASTQVLTVAAHWRCVASLLGLIYYLTVMDTCL